MDTTVASILLKANRVFTICYIYHEPKC